jgi:hypothetical protein
MSDERKPVPVRRLFLLFAELDWIIKNTAAFGIYILAYLLCLSVSFP